MNNRKKSSSYIDIMEILESISINSIVVSIKLSDYHIFENSFSPDHKEKQRSISDKSITINAFDIFNDIILKPGSDINLEGNQTYTIDFEKIFLEYPSVGSIQDNNHLIAGSSSYITVVTNKITNKNEKILIKGSTHQISEILRILNAQLSMDNSREFSIDVMINQNSENDLSDPEYSALSELLPSLNFFNLLFSDINLDYVGYDVSFPRDALDLILDLTENSTSSYDTGFTDRFNKHISKSEIFTLINKGSEDFYKSKSFDPGIDLLFSEINESKTNDESSLLFHYFPILPIQEQIIEDSRQLLNQIIPIIFSSFNLFIVKSFEDVFIGSESTSSLTEQLKEHIPGKIQSIIQTIDRINKMN